MPSISEKTEIGLPLKNLLGLLAVTATAVWAYFGIIERLNNIETRATLFEADLVKNADQTPIDQEQFMLLEFVSEQVEGMSEDTVTDGVKDCLEKKRIMERNMQSDTVRIACAKVEAQIETIEGVEFIRSMSKVE